MYIKEIIVDGFKSYAQRTVIGPFDPEFNAITGENGSGKSNILDAICFVLGISNLGQVRVSSLQELVYKNGQAGITKASVAIVFDNRDKATSPYGYESSDEITVTRQVVVGGRNKYLINGFQAQQSQVQNLFHSVGLNVNNPHFLIMQGRITKVLNMKPIEILQLLEEAAGTRMFETKKEAAMKTMEKKEQKMAEIQKVLDEDIRPTLERLREDRATYLEYTEAQAEIEKLHRVLIAVEYYLAEVAEADTAKELQAAAKRLQERKAEARAKAERAAAASKQLQEETEKREKQMSKSYRENEHLRDELSKVLVQQTTLCENFGKTLAADRGLADRLRTQIAEAEAALQAKRREHAEAAEAAAAARAESTKANELAEQLQRSVQRAEAGIEDNESGGTLTEQIMAAKAALQAASVAAQEADLRMQRAVAEMTERRKALKGADAEVRRLAKELSDAEAEVARLQGEMAATSRAAQEEMQLSAQLASRRLQAQEARERVDALAPRLSALEFTYQDPVPKFDRSRVFGTVAQLITLKDDKFATALEIAAGGRLQNVVVDSEVTGKLVLEKGQLRKRVTLIPLNKIVPNPVPDKVVREAQARFGADRVMPALSLIQYDERVATAMQYVFGSVLVCADAKTAQEVTFSKDLRCRTVTLDGDSYDPQGTVSGGSRASGSGVLVALAELKAQRAALSAAESDVAALTAKMARVRGSSDKHQALAEQMELADHKVTLLKQRASQGAHAQALAAVEALQAEADKHKAALAAAREAEKAARQKAAELEKAAGAQSKAKSAGVKELQGKLAEARKALAAATRVTRAAEQAEQRVSMEMNALSEELASLNEQMNETQASIQRTAAELERANAQLADTRAKFDKAQSAVDAEQRRLAATDKTIAGLRSEIDRAREAAAALEVEAKQCEQAQARLLKEQKDAQAQLAALSKKHTWIAAERQLFGKAGTEYEFKGDTDKFVHRTRERIARLEEQQKVRSKKLNKKVMAMFEKAETEFKDLIAKKTIIENDKEKIRAVILELDEKKNDALKKTWEKVNRDFGSIFSMLLPGAFAKLEPEKGKSELDGLEVRVSFGGVWKESLSELSGGQRSLLALSLILALLLFKPAPVYLLDEVDAALDLSHTQNIGKMLKTHFSQSQFIVISLKDGMFNNANVLFRTQFVDGVSTVVRTTPGASAAARARKSIAAGVARAPAAAGAVPAAAAAAAAAASSAGPAAAAGDENEDPAAATAGKGVKPARKRGAPAPAAAAAAADV